MGETDVLRLMRQYAERYEAGGSPDPGDLLAQLEGADRAELEALIEAYLARAPRDAWDAEAYAKSPAREVVDSLDRSLAGVGGLWPAVLPRLRNRARLRRREVVERLAGALGVADREEKVGGYYHQMEQGLLPVEGVSDRVLEALGRIVGQSAEALRRSGSGLLESGGAGGPAGEVRAFARRSMPDAAYSMDAPASPGTTADRAEEPAEWDEVDVLFRGG